jgi:uncharacterized protein (TIGR02118 family)
MYPAGDGVTFDFDYYRTKHMEIVKKSGGVVRTEVDQAVNGPYIAIGHFYFESAEALEAASNAPTAGHAWADVPNFTNAQPVMQVSQIVE